MFVSDLVGTQFVGFLTHRLIKYEDKSPYWDGDILMLKSPLSIIFILLMNTEITKIVRNFKLKLPTLVIYPANKC